MAKSKKQQHIEAQSIPQSVKKPRIRYSVRQLQEMYDNGNKEPLENLWRAWMGIKALPPEDINSFFNLAGYHGEPFTGGGAYNPKYWGGYCNHGNVLFPTWHRVYCLKVEEALRTIVPDVTLPYWDETSEDSLKMGIPKALTQQTVLLPKREDDPEGTTYITVDGKEYRRVDNPLISFTLPEKIDDLKNDPVQPYAYTKHAGYTTVRYPLSGLVGTEEARIKTLIHNDKYSYYPDNVTLLDKNIVAWLNAGATRPPHDHSPPRPGSIHSKFVNCLQAPTYTLFSNTVSASAYNAKHPEAPVTPLESPHNDIHLAVGGYDFPGFRVGQVAGSNGDMGENNTASFDPIFFFHHCNVDRMFWLWQEQTGHTDDFDIDTDDPGARSDTLPNGQGPTPNFVDNAVLSMDTPLTPFMVSPEKNQRMYTSRDAINIRKQMGYTYSDGSLDKDQLMKLVKPKARGMAHGKVLRVYGINRELFAGSFIINVYANVDGEEIYIGNESILSRWSVKQCANCLNHLPVEAFFPLDELTAEQIEKAEFEIDIKSRDGGFKHLLDFSHEIVGG